MKFRKVVSGKEEWVEEHSDVDSLEGLVNKVHGSAPIPADTSYEVVNDVEGGDGDGEGESGSQPVGGGDKPPQAAGDGSDGAGTAEGQGVGEDAAQG